jgi:hypothetical protein
MHRKSVLETSEKSPLLRYTAEDCVKKIIREIVCEDVDWIELADFLCSGGGQL